MRDEEWPNLSQVPKKGTPKREAIGQETDIRKSRNPDIRYQHECWQFSKKNQTVSFMCGK